MRLRGPPAEGYACSTPCAFTWRLLCSRCSVDAQQRREPQPRLAERPLAVVRYRGQHLRPLQAQGALFYDIGDSGVWAGANVRYDSGLVTGADPNDLLSDPDNAFAAPFIVVHANTNLDPNRIQSRTIVDLSLGADLQRYHLPLSIQADLLNATNKKGLYNIESVFGGTHVTPPRMLALRLKYAY